MEFNWIKRTGNSGTGAKVGSHDFVVTVRKAGKREEGTPNRAQLSVRFSKDLLKRLRWQFGDRLDFAINSDATVLGCKRVTSGGYALGSVYGKNAIGAKTWYVARSTLTIPDGWPFVYGDTFAGDATENDDSVLVLPLTRV